MLQSNERNSMTHRWHTPMQEDLDHRCTEIHWPKGFEPEHAELFSHNELLIHAPAEKIWRHIVAATAWPEWYPNAKHVKVIGGGDALEADSRFSWNTFGIDLESRVNEYVPTSRLSWYGYAPGTQPNFYHAWYLVPQDAESCLVITDEAGIGPDAAAFREHNQGLLHRGHDVWLATLKWMAEDN
jgi:uncharacterized protein YndB with AHSA1/START domain